MLLLRHPAFYDLSCNDCQTYMQVDGKVSRRAGLPVFRPRGVVTPCHKCPKIPPSVTARIRQAAVEPSKKNKQAIRHYYQCKAVYQFPDDPLVVRNAGIIHEVEEAVRSQRLDVLLDIASLLVGQKMNGGS